MKLIITDREIKGPSTISKSYFIDCPFEKGETYKGGLEDFKYRILQSFKLWGEGGVMTAQYDFELEPEFIGETELRQAQVNFDQHIDDAVHKKLNKSFI